MEQSKDEPVMVKDGQEYAEGDKRGRTLLVPVEVAESHVHLSQPDAEILFGQGYQMQVGRELNQPGHYAYKETVTLAGPAGAITGVGCFGPSRTSTQVEVTLTDGVTLGITPPLRESGLGVLSPIITIVGPSGAIVCTQGVICALRHLHLSTATAKQYGIRDGDLVSVATHGPRALVFNNVKARVKDEFYDELHIDLDEARAANLENGHLVVYYAGTFCL